MKSRRSDSDSESSNKSVDRRVEFEDGRVVYLPNNMPEERVRELRQNQQDLAFNHRYNAGDICLGPREDHWEALGRRSENEKLFIMSVYMNRLSAAVTNNDWDAARENMRAILDVDPAKDDLH
jgi:hypothetical protein